jgi:hypothetical protein
MLRRAHVPALLTTLASAREIDSTVADAVKR